jgi:membrane associated rhomboid family serine protease
VLGLGGIFVWAVLWIGYVVIGVIMMRRFYPGFTPLTTYSLIFLNVFVFFAGLAGGIGPVGEHLGLRPAAVLRGEDIHSLLTAFFMHKDTRHLFGNMIYLLISGFIMERSLGSFRFLLFYLFVGLAVSFADLGIRSDSLLPAMGASGAVSGIFGACLIGASSARVPVFFNLLLLLPPLTLLSTLGSVFFYIAIFLYFPLLYLLLRSIVGKWREESWYLLPFLSLWILSQALLAAIGAPWVYYWAHAIGIVAGFLGWLILKPRAEIAPEVIPEVPPIGGF